MASCDHQQCSWPTRGCSHYFARNEKHGEKQNGEKDSSRGIKHTLSKTNNRTPANDLRHAISWDSDEPSWKLIAEALQYYSSRWLSEQTSRDTGETKGKPIPNIINSVFSLRYRELPQQLESSSRKGVETNPFFGGRKHLVRNRKFSTRPKSQSFPFPTVEL